MMTAEERDVLEAGIDRAWADGACFTYYSLWRLLRATPPEERAPVHDFLKKVFEEWGAMPPASTPYVVAYVRTDQLPSGRQYVRRPGPQRPYCVLVEVCDAERYEGAIRQRQAILARKHQAAASN